jgi:transcription antitermination protein NusB
VSTSHARREHEPTPGERRAARERALDLLYEAEAKDLTPSEVLSSLPVEPDPFAEELVVGVERELESIDALIAKHAKGWAVDRMPAIDRQLMRIATYELIARADVSRAVVIDEAVELAQDFSTAESSAYVNGVLSAIADELGR